MTLLDGFSQSDMETRGEARCLDQYTMVIPPVCTQPVGSFQHTNAMERLMFVAMSGPVRELINRGLPCDLDYFQKFPVDWNQAWIVAEFLWKEESHRKERLGQMFHNGPAVLLDDPALDFADKVTTRLLEHGMMTGSEVRGVWNDMKSRAEARSNRWERRRPVVYDFPDRKYTGGVW
jgi:hypothetical protein